jgi:branched-chain amino acid transport system substrate-binding protein
VKLLRLISVGVVIALVIAAAVLVARRDGSANHLKVAIASSLTGDLAENGKDLANGAKMAIDEANAHGGAQGRKIEVVVFDDQGDPKMAVSVANRICQDSGFVAVIGHLTSGSMSAAAPVYARAGIPVVMPVPTNPEITRRGFGNLFRIPPTDDDQAPYLAQYLLSADPKAPVAVVNDMTAYGTGFARAFVTAFKADGGNVVASEGAQRNARDFRSLVAKLKALKPKYVILGATYDMGAPFLRQMKESGMTARVLAGDGCYGSAFVEQARGAAEGSIVSFIAPDRASSPKTEAFFRKYEKLYGKVVSFAPLGYDAGVVILHAISTAKSADRPALLETLSAPSFHANGITGEIAFEKNGDNRNKNLSLYVVRGNRFVLLK